MTILTGKLTSIGGQPWGGPGHFVVIFSRLTRPGPNSTVILELRDRIPMPTTQNGEFNSPDMDPGPIRVELEGGELHGQAWDLILPEPPPEEEPAELATLINTQFEWTPGFVSRTESAARRAEEARGEAEGFRDESAGHAATTGADALAAHLAAMSAEQDAEQTGDDRQAVADDRVWVAGARSDVSEMSAATIAAAHFVVDQTENMERAEAAAETAEQARDDVVTATESTAWDGDRLTILGKQSAPLTGPPGDEGPVATVEAQEVQPDRSIQLTMSDGTVVVIPPAQDGITPALTAGTATTLPAGSAPTVEVTGPAEAPVISLGVPLPTRTSRILIHSGTGDPTLANFPDAQVGDLIERLSDGQRWKVEAS
ncbi:hypothetical protein NYP18_09240 [Corynebacterium sp. YIM 101645]|uniref:Uncharacterized protein n=1 Tax=Corynebacterium lemuris TaxID=1859292 RepID=A0ABT2FX81_9CORY|nr:hypothetical protein [Corynebacterium lemuris]MCS5479843.1 hypothetical protein [Corynebacterium lemuris]